MPLRRARIVFLLASLVSLPFLIMGVSAQEPQRQILGIHFKLTQEDIHKRLKEIGSFVRNDRKRQEIWEVRDQSFSHLIVSFEKNGKLRFVTAVSREDLEAKRVPYAEIGSLEKARQAGDPAINNFNYEWDLPARDGDPHILVIARGRDPTFLTTHSIKKVDDDPAEAKK